jgi:uncharacterized UPF0160 family protein
VHPSGKAIFLKTACPWKDHLYDLERDYDCVKQILYVVFWGGVDYRIQCVAEEGSAFTSRQPLNAEWRGLSNEKLAAVIGLPDAVFCHATGFIGGMKTWESILKMADMAINQAKPDTAQGEMAVEKKVEKQ